MSEPDPRLAMAIQANIAWYDQMCALHRVRTRLAEGIWTALDRPPPLHSDVQIVAEGISVARALAALGDRRPAGLKDCFATADASAAGMTRLFSASWIHRAAGSPESTTGWHVVRDPDELANWNAGWDTAPVLIPAVLELSQVTVLAIGNGRSVEGGAVLSLVDGVAYLSNVHGEQGPLPDWDGLVAAVAGLAPECPMVGYERGADLSSAVAAGFEVVGGLAVWVR